MKPRNQRETALDDGSSVKRYAYDDQRQFEQNTLLVKLLQMKGLSLSMGEDEDLRRWSISMDQKTQPACYESMQDIQIAQRMAQKTKQAEDFIEYRKAGFLHGGQLDMWERWGHSFACLNYTYLELGELETINGFVPCWHVKSAVLAFRAFEKSHTAVNMIEWMEGVLHEHGLTWEDFALLAVDGASNCMKALEIVKEEVDSTVCFCHDLARAVLYAIGMGAALDQSDRPVIGKLTSALQKMRTLAIKFHRVAALKKALHESQAADGVPRELETLRAAITRWNGIFMGLHRNIQLKAHIEHALDGAGTLNVMTYNEDGDVVMVVKPVADIKPTAEEWNLAAEASTLLLPAYEVTQHLQGLRLTPDQSFVAIHNLYKKCKDAYSAVHKIPQPPVPGSTEVCAITFKLKHIEPQR